MPGTKTSTLSLLLTAALLTPALFAEVEYLPLQPGNQWVYRGPAGGFAVAVEPPITVAGRLYFPVTGFPATPRLFLRHAGDGRLWLWDETAKAEKLWLDFESKSAPTAVDPCNLESRIDARETPYSGPIGEFTYALRVLYTPGPCADAGIESDTFLPYVGLVQRTVQTIAGPRSYDLVYARLGEIAVITEPELSFSLAVDRAASAARLTLRNTTGTPLELHFATSQIFDVAISGPNGRPVWRWSAARTFAQATATLSVTGQRLWVVPLPPLKPGSYTVRARLTTNDGKRFAASTAIDVSP